MIQLELSNEPGSVGVDQWSGIWKMMWHRLNDHQII
jgi:hypothetical protein